MTGPRGRLWATAKLSSKPFESNGTGGPAATVEIGDTADGHTINPARIAPAPSTTRARPTRNPARIPISPVQSPQSAPAADTSRDYCTGKRPETTSPHRRGLVRLGVVCAAGTDRVTKPRHGPTPAGRWLACAAGRR